MDDDCMLAFQFAESLMKYVFQARCIPWMKPNSIFSGHRKRSSPPFNEDIGDAVICIIDKNKKDIFGAHRDLSEMGAKNPISFSRYAVEAAPWYFPDGYTPEALLCYCAMLVGVGELMFEYPPNGIPECTHEVIGTVLTAYILTGEFKSNGGYDKLSDVAEAILKYVHEAEKLAMEVEQYLTNLSK